MSREETAKPLDPFQFHYVVENDDGTIQRGFEYPRTAAAPDDNGSAPVITKDVTFNQEHKTYVRIFLPRQALDKNNTKKLPLIVYYHGGGFILLNADSTPNHDFCYNMAHQLSVVVVSVDYRLAPEHRLPAGYDDSVEALHWIKSTDEKLLRDHVDYSKCYLMGTSAGGNIAYHVGLRVSKAVDDLEPLKIKGLLLHTPFFGSTQRSGSEQRLINDPVLPPSSTDMMWKLSLPIGSDRDHEYCNPRVVEEFDQIKKLGWLIVVTGCDGDPLSDSQKKLVEMLKKKDIKVETQFKEGDYHAVELLNHTNAKALYGYLSQFLEN
ncbi:carboxylesterase 1 [Quercus suber]|uniref:Carboxylesterase 1 n=1 Tax=Quercus suber TaxID=58331 RepID=A0AAW0MAT0_QUESU